MPDDRSFLAGLDKYWTKAQAPKLRAVSNERLIRISSEHWINDVFPTLLYLFLTAVSVFFFILGAFTGYYVGAMALTMTLIAFGFFWCVHHWYFWFMLAERGNRIIITSKRVIYVHSGLLWGEDLIEITFDKLKAVQAHKKNLFQSVFNYGSLDFEGKAIIKRVPHPGTVARVIQQAMGMT